MVYPSGITCIVILYNKIRSLDIELSTSCNASCPGCSRNFSGGPTLPWLPALEISLDDFKKYVPIPLIKQLSSIIFCGNYGDPMLAKDILKICHWLKHHNPNIFLTASTNAGLRDHTFWHEMAQIFQESSYICFAIDGFEETNHIYRKNVSWKKVLESARSFINAGGNAVWEFIVFKHNECDIESARQMASDLGFKHFTTKKAFGFDNNYNVMPVYNSDGRFQYYILPPDNIELRNDQIKDVAISLEKLPTIQASYFPQNMNPVKEKKVSDIHSVDCFAANRNSLFISAEGLLYPCCFLASKTHSFSKDCQAIQNFQATLNQDLLSLRSNSIEKILQTNWIQENFVNPPHARIDLCRQFCGIDQQELKSNMEHKKNIKV